MLNLKDNTLMTKVRKKIKTLFKHLFEMYINDNLNINYLPDINIIHNEN
jgi:hypothetical protein